MTRSKQSRRDFLKTTGSLAAGMAVPYFTWSEKAFANASPNDRPNIGCIGVGGQGCGDAQEHARFGDIVAVCDVDAHHAEAARNHGGIGKGKAEVYGDYRIGRTIKWDPKAEKIVGDDQAAALFARKPREGFEVHRV